MSDSTRVLLLSALLLLAANLLIGTPRAATLTNHAPIMISGDGAFTSANGVVGGSGTRSDPYLIGGWQINSTTVQNGIMISNTRAYFIIRNVDVHGGLGSAVSLNNVTNGAIETSDLSNNAGGVLLAFSSNVTLTSNTISYNKYGVLLAYAANITLRGNVFASDGIYISPSQESELNWRSFTITQDNLVNGRPILFYNGCSGITVDGELVGQLMIANCVKVKIRNLTIMNTDAGIQVGNVSDILIANSTLSSNTETGLSGALVRNCTVTGITASSNGRAGLEIWGGINMTISKSSFLSNQWWGIYLTGSGDVYNQNYRTGPENMTIVANTLSGNIGFGLDARLAKNLLVFHNDFINNAAEDVSGPSSSDAWDDGYPSGGNYWSDYTGIDRCSGPLQNECRCVLPSFDTCPDGIGDTPRLIGQYSNFNPTDRYPLMKPYHPDTTPPIWPDASSIQDLYLTSTSVWLFWTQATDDVKVAQYMLYSNNNLLTTLPGWQYYDNATGLSPSTTYVFHVVAVDVGGNASPALSISVTTPTVLSNASNNIPAWYLLPTIAGATGAVVVTALLTRRHYRKKIRQETEGSPAPGTSF